MYRFKSSALLVAFIGLCGCSSGSSGGGEPAEPADMGTPQVDMTTQPPMDMMIAPPTLTPDTAGFQIPMLGAGQRAVRTVNLNNTGETDAQITQFTLNVTDGSAQLVYGARQIIGIDANGNDTFPYPITVAAGESLALTVEYTLGDGMPGGEVTVAGNFDGGTITLPISALDTVGQISADPEMVDFGRIREDTTATRAVVIRNTGGAVLNITDIQKDLNVYYSLAIGGVDPVEDPSVYADPDTDGMPGLAPGAEFTIDVTFAPTRESIEQSVIIIDSDDPVTPELRVRLIANGSPGCIEVSHETLEWQGPVRMFTDSPEVTVTNCGEGPLVIDRLGLAPGSAEAFELIDDDLPMFPTEVPPGAAPLRFQVRYGPPAARRYRGNVEILSNDPNQSSIVIPLLASSSCTSDDDCAQGYRCEAMECVEMMME